MSYEDYAAKQNNPERKLDTAERITIAYSDVDRTEDLIRANQAKAEAQMGENATDIIDELEEWMEDFAEDPEEFEDVSVHDFLDYPSFPELDGEINQVFDILGIVSYVKDVPEELKWIVLA